MFGNKLQGALVLFGIATFLAQYALAKERVAEHCVHNGKIIEKGGALTAPRGQCYAMLCDMNGVLGRVECYLPITEQGCHKSGMDYTKIYPHCCPFNVCRNDIDVDILN